MALAGNPSPHQKDRGPRRAQAGTPAAEAARAPSARNIMEWVITVTRFRRP